ncbi:histidine kinase [Pleurocapsa sp. FMAR1]|uniref:histidine kinase n=1 Tax=Pleurocapsa sp. FMAR1 TaxID=3040204 RepID=UPI0029C64F17|nr:histidine kinase [Pleurocapsa sp. FMAR1]
MLQSNQQYFDHQENSVEELSLQLLLFVDKRSSSQKQVRKIRTYLEKLSSEYFFKLDVIEIEKQPHLVEYLKLVATPALVKISPTPRQTLAGGNLIEQLEKWWPKWQATQEELKVKSSHNLLESTSTHGINQEVNYAEKIQLKDEIFALKQEREGLVAQLRFKDQILAILAHDLRTPLTAASMAVETLELSEQNEQLEAEKRKYLKQRLFKHAKNQFGIMDSMISELLQSSQNVNAKLQINPSSLDLKRLCQEVVAQFDSRLLEKSMIFKKDIPQDIPCVYADEELIRQLISNLLDNAIKYTPERGQISLSVLHRTNQKVHVSISDTGPGIPPETREQIFEDNFRLQRDRDREGYGIGLAMCQQIVCVHHGQIWVESSPENGSCFQFTLLVYK